MDAPDPTVEEAMIRELVEFFEHEEFEIEGARVLSGYARPPTMENETFGDLQSRTPDVIGLDRKSHRIVFGIHRPDRASLDSEESLTDYNFYLDHNAHLGPKASVVYVMMTDELVQEFTDIVTHYIHRDYWHRIIPIRYKASVKQTNETPRN